MNTQQVNIMKKKSYRRIGNRVVMLLCPLPAAERKRMEQAEATARVSGYREAPAESGKDLQRFYSDSGGFLCRLVRAMQNDCAPCGGDGGGICR